MRRNEIPIFKLTIHRGSVSQASRGQQSQRKRWRSPYVSGTLGRTPEYDPRGDLRYPRRFPLLVCRLDDESGSGFISKENGRLSFGHHRDNRDVGTSTLNRHSGTDTRDSASVSGRQCAIVAVAQETVIPGTRPLWVRRAALTSRNESRSLRFAQVNLRPRGVSSLLSETNGCPGERGSTVASQCCSTPVQPPLPGFLDGRRQFHLVTDSMEM